MLTIDAALELDDDGGDVVGGDDAEGEEVWLPSIVVGGCMRSSSKAYGEPRGPLVLLLVKLTSCRYTARPVENDGSKDDGR